MSEGCIACASWAGGGFHTGLTTQTVDVWGGGIGSHVRVRDFSYLDPRGAISTKTGRNCHGKFRGPIKDVSSYMMPKERLDKLPCAQPRGGQDREASCKSL